MISDYSKYKVSKAFIFGLSIVVILWLFGPYEYKIYDYGGIVYFAFCCFLLLLGMRCRNLVFRRKSINDESNDSRIIHFYLSDKAVLFMCVIDIISIIAALYYLSMLKQQVGIDFTYGQADYRGVISENRNNLSRASEALMHLSAPIYIIINSSSTNLSRGKSALVLLGYWSTPLAYLGAGARWSLYFYLVLFIQFAKMRRGGHLLKRNLSPKTILFAVVSVALIIFVLSIVYNLFEVRGLYKADELFLFEKGDMHLRKYAQYLYDKTNGALNALYKVSNYFSHSIVAFTYTFKYYDTSTPIMFGLYSLSVLQYIFIPFGLKTDYMKNIIYSIPGSGVYLTYLHGYFIDFGMYLTPVIVFITGFLFSKVQKYANSRILCRCLFPYILVMCFIAPIYNMWNVAIVNIDLFVVVILIKFLKRFHYLEICEDENVLINER